MRKKILLITLLVNIIYPSFAGGPVWKISFRGNYIYLAADILTFSKQDLPAPKSIRAAYENSGIVVSDVDYGKLEKSYFHDLKEKYNTYSPEERLENFIDKYTFKKIVEYFSDKTSRTVAENTDIYNRTRAGYLSAVIAASALMFSGQEEYNLSRHFFLKGMEEKKADSLDSLLEDLEWYS